MASSKQQNSQQDAYQSPNPQEWQALRGELVALLEQVEGRFVRPARQTSSLSGLADQVRRLRDGGEEPDTRHREALRSVQRAVNRFSERDAGEVREGSSRAALEAAIGEIRSRQREPQAAAPRDVEAPRFADMARSVEGLSGRLERLEVELKDQRHSAANVARIADQVGEVSQVVELLASAVGESGQVKQLEGQIANLAKLISEGQRLDMTALTQRLDEVSATVERLADLQIEHVARQKDTPALSQRLAEVTASVERLAEIQAQAAERGRDDGKLDARLSGVTSAIERILEAQEMQARASRDVPAQQEAISAGMHAIETGVRHVYDRIDAIERSYALSPADFEKLTEEMAGFTKAMQETAQPQGLLQLVDALNSRISDIESRDSEVGGLKNDVEALRDAVLGAMEPRMAAIESSLAALNEGGSVGSRMGDIQTQLEALNERVAERPADPSVGQIEAQVRQLVARMDQTGEQLTGLARLYSEQGERDAPDFEALAELVATRTSDAIRADGPPPSAMTETGMSDLEERMERLFKAVAAERPAADFTDMNEGIRRVDERLDRLEVALNRLADEERSQPEAIDHRARPDTYASLDNADDTSDYGPEVFSAQPPARRTDAMPSAPSEERPLTDTPFPDLGPVRDALEARLGSRKHHPGLADEPLDFEDISPLTPQMFGRSSPSPKPDEALRPPVFDPELVVRPPRPVSSLTDEDASFGDDAEVAATPDTDFADSTPAPAKVQKPVAVESSARSTFIEAARKAAQAQNNLAPEVGSNSLIGRALARFQPGGDKPSPLADLVADAAGSRAARKAAKAAKAEAAKAAKAEARAAERAKKAAQTDPRKSEPEVTGLSVGTPDLERDLPGDAPKSPPEASIEPGRPAEPDVVQESFLLRHRKPILLAASVVALAFLTLNLVNQRLSEATPDAPSTPEIAPASVQPTSLNAPSALVAPLVKPRAVAAAPRVIPMIDSLETGSVTPAALNSFVPSSPMPRTPEALEAAVLDSPIVIPELLDGPVQVELPQDSVGPLDLRQAAADGDARAQFEVGAIFTEGRAVPRDMTQAATWYERAAAQGFAPAQYRLGNLYENGQGVAKDLEQARLWYQRAAEAGNRMSMHNLAALFAGGNLGKQEFASAAEWFERAANEGLTDSQFNLGMLYARGLGVPQNMATSYKWFALAARNGDKDAVAARDDVAKSLDAEVMGGLTAEVAAWTSTPINLAANFAPIGTWSASFDPGEPIKTREVVVGVQTLLNRLGFDIGTPDGVAGPRTAEAIRAFEKATGMSESGTINPRLLAVLSSQPT